jgi:5-methylcytosine-specific restriction protein A
VEKQVRPPKFVTFGDGDGRRTAQIISRAWVEYHAARGAKLDYDGNVITNPLSPGRREWHRLSPRLRPLVLLRDEYTCQQCGVTELDSPLHIDHIVSLAKGGTNDLDNLQVLCQPCNQKKWAN